MQSRDTDPSSLSIQGQARNNTEEPLIFPLFNHVSGKYIGALTKRV
jgi:hypothetical protein